METSNDRSRFLLFFASKGKTLYVVRGCGACFYRSVAVDLDRDAQQHGKYCNIVMNYTESDRDYFRRVVVGEGSGVKVAVSGASVGRNTVSVAIGARLFDDEG